MTLDRLPVGKDANRLLALAPEHRLEPGYVGGRPRGDERVVLVVHDTYPRTGGRAKDALDHHAEHPERLRLSDDGRGRWKWGAPLEVAEGTHPRFLVGEVLDAWWRFAGAGTVMGGVLVEDERLSAEFGERLV